MHSLEPDEAGEVCQLNLHLIVCWPQSCSCQCGGHALGTVALTVRTAEVCRCTGTFICVL